MQSIVGIRRDLREQLAQRYTLEQGRILTHNTSEDGTRKFLMQFGAGQEIESALPVPHLKRPVFTLDAAAHKHAPPWARTGVFIPEPTRGTLCVSSQVGCTLSCSFCHTGTQPVVLTTLTHSLCAQRRRTLTTQVSCALTSDAQFDDERDLEPDHSRQAGDERLSHGGRHRDEEAGHRR